MSQYYLQFIIKKNLPDVKKPEETKEELKINYAYVVQGGIVINLPDKSTLANTPLYWKYSYEKDFKPISADCGYGYSYKKDNSSQNGDFSKLFTKYNFNKYDRLDKNDYRIPVDIPSRVQIVIVDNKGNTKPYEFRINEDNFILNVGKAPEYVKDILLNLKNGRDYNDYEYDRYSKKDLLVVRKNSTIDLYQNFKSLLTSTWDSFNSRELEFAINDTIIKEPSSVKFDEVGSYKVNVSKEDSNKTVDFTILVLDKINKDYKYEIKDNVEITKNEFTGYDLFKNKDKADINRFYIEYDKNYYLLDYKFNFDKTKEYKLTLVDIKDNRKFTVNVKKVGLKAISYQNAINMFTDINKHWAKDKIIALVSKGVIAGYPDSTFKPDNNMTKREAIAFIGRYAENMNQAYIKPTIRTNVAFNKTNWGNEEVDFVLGRVPANLINEGNLDEKITREEVALLLEKTFLFNETNKSLTFKDKEDIKFANSVEKLVAFGSIKGYPDNTFKAKGYITRAEFISMLFTLPNVNY